MSHIHPDFKATPYWWEAAPPNRGTREVPENSYDAVVVGSGVTGLNAALTLSAGGRKTAVLDAESIGSGASSRNNGVLLPFHFLLEDELKIKFGKTIASELVNCWKLAYEHAISMPVRYHFDPQLKSYERYYLALSAKQRHRLEHKVEVQKNSGIQGWKTLGSDELSLKTGLRSFCGGIEISSWPSMHPGVYMQGLARACVASGVDLVGHCRVLEIAKDGASFLVKTRLGSVRARNVVVATDGYTGKELPKIRKRLMSVRLYMAATEPMSEEMRKKFFPENRQFGTGNLSHTWVRPTPDGTRVLVGGRGGMMGNNPERHATALHADLVKLMPELAPLKITHCWYGLTGFAYDLIPHIGEIDGIHYVLGLAGIGMSVGGWLGSQVGHKILGATQGESSFGLDSVRTPKEPIPGQLYARLGVLWYATRDWWDS
jgi:glycine/D-amino acid oxidase-like deaminating enzyme